VQKKTERMIRLDAQRHAVFAIPAIAADAACAAAAAIFAARAASHSARKQNSETSPLATHAMMRAASDAMRDGAEAGKRQKTLRKDGGACAAVDFRARARR